MHGRHRGSRFHRGRVAPGAACIRVGGSRARASSVGGCLHCLVIYRVLPGCRPSPSASVSACSRFNSHPRRVVLLLFGAIVRSRSGPRLTESSPQGARRQHEIPTLIVFASQSSHQPRPTPGAPRATSTRPVAYAAGRWKLVPQQAQATYTPRAQRTDGRSNMTGVTTYGRHSGSPGTRVREPRSLICVVRTESGAGSRHRYSVAGPRRGGPLQPRARHGCGTSRLQPQGPAT